MEAFKYLQSLLRYMGILQYDDTNRGRAFTFILNCVYMGLFASFFLTTLCYFIYSAKTFVDFSENVIFLACSLLNIVWYSNFIYRRYEYVILFIELDTIISKSMYNIYA